MFHLRRAAHFFPRDYMARRAFSILFFLLER